MESQVSPKNIEARVDAMTAASAPKPVETTAAPEAAKPEAAKPEAAKPEAAAPEAVKPEAAKPEAAAPEAVKPEAAKPEAAKPEAAKPEAAKPAEKKTPNDPAELRRWSTKLSQENAALRDEMKSIKTAIEKLSKKPVDYAELAKNPDGLKAHIEAERQEAIKELQTQLTEKHTEATRNATMYERAVRERDTENYPRWEKLFPLIQTLANNGDGRINWNQAPGAALDEAYALASQLSPSDVVAPPAPPVDEVKPVAGLSEAEVAAKIAEAVVKAKAETRAEVESGIRNEQNGAGIGSAGRGGKRDNNVSNDALKKMPLKDLKTLISKE